MFHNIPLQAITINLADTHSILLTVDRILNNSIYIPAQEVCVLNHISYDHPKMVAVLRNELWKNFYFKVNLRMFHMMRYMYDVYLFTVIIHICAAQFKLLIPLPLDN